MPSTVCIGVSLQPLKLRGLPILRDTIRQQTSPPSILMPVTLYLLDVPNPKKVNKLTVTWTGPARGLGFTTPLVAKTQNLVDGKVKDIHVSRLKFYNSATLDVTDKLKEHHLPTFNSLPCRELKEVRRSFRRRFDVLVSRVGSRARILDRQVL